MHSEKNLDYNASFEQKKSISEAINNFDCFTSPLVSIDEIMSEEQIFLGDFIPNDERSTDEEKLYALFKDQLDNNIHKLSSKEELLLKLRLGITDGEEKTIEEVAKILDISVARAELLEKKALRALRGINDLYFS